MSAPELATGRIASGRALRLQAVAAAGAWPAALVRRELQLPGTRAALTTFAATLTRLLLGLAASSLIARALGPEAFGLVALVNLAVAFTSTFADFGLNHAAITSIARRWEHEPEGARTVAAGYSALAALLWLVAAGAGLLLAGPLAALILQRPEAEFLLRIGFVGMLPAVFASIVNALFVATRRFGAYSQVQILLGVLYLAGTLALAALGQLSAASVLLLTGLLPLATLAVGRRQLPPGLFDLRRLRSAPARGAWAELARPGRWLWVASLSALAAWQLDLFLVGRLAPAAALGVYALAATLAARADIFTPTRFLVLLPSAARLRGRLEIGAYVRGSLKRSLLLSLPYVAALPALEPFLLTVYGPAFVGAAPALAVLLGVIVFELFSGPLLLLAFPLDAAPALAAANTARVAILIGASLALVPVAGLTGAALAKLLSRVAGALLALALLRRAARRAALAG